MTEAMARFWKLIDVVMALLMAVTIALVFINVVLRYGFSSGLRPALELSRLGFVWIVLLGAASCLLRGEHLAVDDFSRAFMPSALPILRRSIWFVILVSSAMLFWGAQKQVVANWNNISQLTGLPSSVFYIAGVVSGLLMMGIALLRLARPDTDGSTG